MYFYSSHSVRLRTEVPREITRTKWVKNVLSNREKNHDMILIVRWDDADDGGHTVSHLKYKQAYLLIVRTGNEMSH